jgi:hypothetical protein
MYRVDENAFRLHLKGIFLHVLQQHPLLPEFVDNLTILRLQQRTTISRDIQSNKYFVKLYLRSFSETLARETFQTLLGFFNDNFYRTTVGGVNLFDRREFDRFNTIQYFQLSLEGCLAFLVHQQ